MAEEPKVENNNKPKIEKVKTADYPFDKVMGVCKVRIDNGAKVERSEIIDLRLLKHLLCFIQENEGKDCTSLEMVFVDCGDGNPNKLIGFKTRDQTDSGSNEFYLLCPLYGHHYDGTGLVKRFKDVPRKMYVQLPVYSETMTANKEKTRFDMIAEVMGDEENDGEE